ncbi:S-layer homology domain-containing protein [Paenibacillus chungangensis]|uniref:S-layer homology domain-containing protein n=1 Tax=Paenibacillus chungangensis TaxID=696535 RepID=A0ABW3HTU0_9BACL
MRKAMKQVTAALVAGTVFGCLLYVSSAGAVNSSAGGAEAEAKPAAVKSIRKVDRMADWASSYRYMDFDGMAQRYDELLFAFAANPAYVPVDQTASYMPIGYWDDTNHNGYGRMFGFPSYIGHVNGSGEGTMTPGAQEAISTLAPLLSGMLAGIDKTNQYGYNLAEMANGFHNAANGEEMVLNRTNTSTGQSFWYELYPQLLHIQIYETAKRKFGRELPSMRNIIVQGAEKWLEALPNFKDSSGKLSFDFTSYNMKTDEPVRNEGWIEPPGGALAYIFYSAYETTGEQKYLDAMALVMDELNASAINPNYEVTQDYSPLMAAVMNFRFGQKYNVDKMINWLFDADSDVRTGWGVMEGEWGGYQADGLVGAERDGGGYGFLMNTYHLGSVLAPLAKYDPRYSDAVGKWFLSASNSVRLMYPNEVPATNQSHGGAFQHDPDGVIGYEGVRRSENGVAPYATGDPVSHGWGQTNYGIYGSSLIGVFAAIIDPTSVERILRLDLNATDYYREAGSFPQYLYYNPYPEARHVTVELDGPSKLFDVVAKTTIVANASGNYNLTIPTQSSRNVIVLPAEADIRHVGTNWMVGARTIAKDAIGVNILSPSVQRKNISADTVELTLELTGSDNASMEIAAGDTLLYSGPFMADYSLETARLTNGIVDIAVTVNDANGLSDTANIKLEISRPDEANIIYEASAADALLYTPVAAMPATVSDSGEGYTLITETNEDGDWGAVQSDSIEVDFSRRPFLELEAVWPDPYYTVQIKFEDEQWGKYVLSNGGDAGKKLIDLKNALASFGDRDRTDKVPLRIYLMANGKEGASFGMKSLKLFYDDPPAVAADVTFEASDIVNFVSGESPGTATLIGKKGIMENRTDNEGYGGVQSDTFTLDFARNPSLLIDIAEVGEGNTYTLKLLWGGTSYYVYANRVASGMQTINLAQGILDYQSQAPNGSGEARLELWATDKKGAYFIVNSLEVIYEDETTAYAADKATIETFESSSAPGRIGYINAAARVTENHPDGDYGTVRSAPFLLDFDKPIRLAIDVAQATARWTLQLKFEGDEHPKYLVADYTTTGIVEVDVAYMLRQYDALFDKTGLQRVTLYVMANGAEDASVDVRSIAIRHGQPENYAIELDKKLMELTAGESAEATARLVGGDVNAAVIWSSSDDNVASVDSSGSITAIGSGTATIRAERSDRPSVEASLTLAVLPARAETITAEAPQSALAVGSRVTLKPIVSPSNAVNRQWIFRSSNSTVAQVDPEGTVTVTGAGTTVIDIRTEDHYASASVEVTGYTTGNTGVGGSGSGTDSGRDESAAYDGEWREGLFMAKLHSYGVARAVQAAGEQGGIAQIAVSMDKADMAAAEGFSVAIPEEVWKGDAWTETGVRHLLLGSPLGDIQLSIEAVLDLYRDRSGTLQLTLRKADTAQLAESVREVAGGRQIYAFIATLDGEELPSAAGVHLALVTLPVAGAAAVVDELSAAGVERANLWSDRTAGGVSFMVGGTVYFVLANQSNHYVDTNSHWAAESIALATARGLMQGIGGGRFAPEQGMTRAMAVHMLANLEQTVNSGSVGGVPFTDTNDEEWYAAAAGWAYEAGVIVGTGNGKFEPYRLVTREEMAVMLLRYAQYIGLALQEAAEWPENEKADEFVDAADIQPWAKEAVRLLHSAGIHRGKEGNRFAPGDNLTRAQAAALMQEWIGYTIRTWRGAGW